MGIYGPEYTGKYGQKISEHFLCSERLLYMLPVRPSNSIDLEFILVAVYTLILVQPRN